MGYINMGGTTGRVYVPWPVNPYRDEQWREPAMSADQLLALVDQALLSESKSRSRGDWGWVAQVLDENTVLIARKES